MSNLLHQVEPNDYWSLEAARVWTMDHASKGTRCPCCSQNVKVYKRMLNATKAVCLISLCRVHEAREGIWSQPLDWVHVSEIPWQGSDARAAGGELAKLEMWNLIERKTPNKDETKRCSGLWRATRLGIMFSMHRLEVPKYVHTYNATVLERSGETITIIEALGEKFSYAKLMAR